MKYYGKPKIEKVESRLCEYLRCDCCKKKINNSRRYFMATIGHNDWGNDSIDSIEHKDICEKCLNKYVKQYFNENKDSATAYIDIHTDEFVKNSSYYGKYDRYEDRLVEEDTLID